MTPKHRISPLWAGTPDFGHCRSPRGQQLMLPLHFPAMAHRGETTYEKESHLDLVPVACLGCCYVLVRACLIFKVYIYRPLKLIE